MSDSAKVVSLSGAAIVPPGDANPRIVAMAEEIAERARSGDIKTLAIAYEHADGAYSFWREGPTGYGLVGAIESMKRRILDGMSARMCV